MGQVNVNFRIAAVISLLLVLAACASQEPKPVTAAEEGIAEAVSQSQAPRDLPPEVSNALLGGGLKPGAPEPERFDIAVNNMPAERFFLGLVSGTDTNMVVHPEVEGTVSLELKDVTLDEVLDVTREVFGYEYARNNGIYTIYPRKLRTEVFPINYLDVRRRGRSDTSVLVGKIESGNNNRFDAVNGGGLNRDDEGEIGSGARIQTSSDADFWVTLDASVRAIVGSEGEGRMVMVNAQTGMVVVKALPTELSAVRNFLEKSQLSAGRQVILETKIIEVRLDDEFAAGIDWSAIQAQMALAYDVVKMNPEFGPTTVDSQAAFSTIFGVQDIGELIDLLDTQGHVQVLSSPRVSTVNNQKALIRVGSDEFFVTGISNQTTASAAITTTTPTVELASFFSGIALDVTPQIAENGDVILHVHPVVSEVTDQLKQLTVGDEEFALPLALRDIRESDSIVRARDGQVIVLGGLMQKIKSERRTDRPGLASVPGLNLLFKHRRDQEEKTELVILMRPVVVTDEAWERDIRQTEQRIQGLGADYRARF
ncbi:pilus (MSHA type) biogenesis protein MshL [Proteobacteria bacterium 005FR1]|nr:pilus (MSHA type) biogenesis protein MshL [Proteobacteria bacterium 005FR1]